MSTNTACTTCQSEFPAAATFCPYCGATAGAEAAPFNKTLVGNLLREPSPKDTIMMDAIEDFRPGRKHGVKLFVGVAVTGAVIAGIFAGSWLADLVYRQAEPVSAVAVVEAEVAPTPVVPEVAVSSNATGGFDITRGAEIIHTVHTIEGSRYNTVDERMRSVAVRFKHISSKGEGRFAARLVGDHYELVWADENGDFRLLDVTEQDVAGSESNTDFAANFLADRLNADLPLPHNS